MSFQIKLCGVLIVSSILASVLCQKRVFLLISTTTVAAMSMVGYFATVLMIPVMCKYMLNRRIFGLDINKKGT
jgi:hypothetical protein